MAQSLESQTVVEGESRTREDIATAIETQKVRSDFKFYVGGINLDTRRVPNGRWTIEGINCQNNNQNIEVLGSFTQQINIFYRTGEPAQLLACDALRDVCEAKGYLYTEEVHTPSGLSYVKSIGRKLISIANRLEAQR